MVIRSILRGPFMLARIARTPLVICCVLGLLGIQSLATEEDQPGPKKFKGRVIAPVMTAEGGGAEWLERRDRDESEQPEKVIDALKIAPGSVVADVGAGTGYFSLRIARRI